MQLAERVKRRAQGVAKKFDKIDGEGMLLRGAVYLKELTPGAGYRDKIESIKLKRSAVREYINKLRRVAFKMRAAGFVAGGDDFFIDTDKFRILTSVKNARRVRIPGCVSAAVREYPTWDQLEMDVEFFE